MGVLMSILANWKERQGYHFRGCLDSGDVCLRLGLGVDFTLVCVPNNRCFSFFILYYYHYCYIRAQAFDLGQNLYSTFLLACMLRLILHGAGLRRLVTQYDTKRMMIFNLPFVQGRNQLHDSCWPEFESQSMTD